ncbi:hypothetical protein CRUP_001098, partial [Coryphaenoides rupestris]
MELSSGDKQVMTGDLWYDLTSVVWASMWSSRDVFRVNVSAVRGHDGQESSRSPSFTFTFNKLKEMENPFHTPELRWAPEREESDALVLIFSVTEDGGIETS